MKTSSILSVGASYLVAFLSHSAQAQDVTGQLGNAKKYTDNPQGVSYVAELPKSPTSSTRGYIVATDAGKRGTAFTVNFSGLPAVGGPFLYHIHVSPISADGNCTSALGHLDPYIRGETPPCDKLNPDSCQVGDLSGKYGTINGTEMSVTYVDPFVTMQTDQGAFFGNRSFVIHYANTTRYTCANFSSASVALGETPSPGNLPPGGSVLPIPGASPMPNVPVSPPMPNGFPPGKPPMPGMPPSISPAPQPSMNPFMGYNGASTLPTAVSSRPQPTKPGQLSNAPAAAVVSNSSVSSTSPQFKGFSLLLVASLMLTV